MRGWLDKMTVGRRSSGSYCIAMPLLVYFGDDFYSMNRALEAVRHEGDFQEMDVMRLDARVGSPQEVLLSLGTPSLFSSRRLVILTGINEKAKGRKSKKASATQTEITAASLLASTPESTTVVLMAPGIKADAAFIKEAVATARQANGELRLREFAAPKPREMTGWLARQAKDLGVRLEPEAATQLALRVGDQVSIAGAELSKLITAAHPSRTITAAMVEELIPQSAEESIFPLIDAVTAGNPATAIKLLERQIAQGRSGSPDVALPLLRLLARQFRILLTIQLMLQSGAKPDSISASLRLPSYFSGRYFAQAKRVGRTHLMRGIEMLAATEQSIKTGEVEEGFLQLLVADLAAPSG